MNKNALRRPAFIWDLDGTLLDSYGVIVSSLEKTYQEFGVELDREIIRKEILTSSVNDFISNMEKTLEIPFDAVRRRCSEINDSEKLSIRPIRHAAEILSYLRGQGSQNYVFTHRGLSTEAVLKNTGLYDFFADIVTGKDGFGRKPDPSAILYLVRKHDLDRNTTFYVGDRTLDIECADNAGVKSILYLPEDSVTRISGKETYVVKDLLDIKEIFRPESGEMDQ